ncbi:hypothetical protein EVAR_8219_1 [Eumeta japonica]|uniref:Uncharacterized protein n=1 Tax=Eumeta variegata TaxID=151549 RepID=A0A4C1TI89_EUMVA|nr:hypothetical protein EVAR_8219_1 [Eumeta japonica]
MDEDRCATCDALCRRGSSGRLLQIATAQAHIQSCTRAASPPDPGPDADLATRALAAKRRKSIAGLKLNLPSDTTQKTTLPEHPRSHFARRNSWCP